MKNWMYISIFAIVVMSVGGVILYNSKTIEDIDSEIVVVKKEITTNKINNLDTCEVNGKAYFEIDELGIKILVDESIINDLEYVFYKDMANRGNPMNEVDYVSLSSKKLSKMDNGCADGFALGKIGKVMNSAKDSSAKTYSEGKKVKQFDDYFIFYTGPQAPCSDIGEIEELARSIRNKIFIMDINDKKCIQKIK